MSKYSCLILLCAIFFTFSSIKTTTPAQLTQIQLTEQTPDKHPKKSKVFKKKKYAQFEYIYRLTKENTELFEQSFSQAPDKVKAIVNEHLHRTAIASKYKMLLLTGPSGSGKSTLAQAIAYKLGRNCEVIPAPTLLGHFRDQAAEAIKNLFKRIQKDPRKPILVLDEMNVLTDDHASEHSDTKHTAMQLWTCLDKYAKKKNFLLIGTTNETKKMPHQLQSRFRNKTFVIEQPLHEARKQTLKLYLEKVTLDETCNDAYLDELAKKMSNFSQRDIEELIEDSVILAGIDNSDLSKRILSKKHLEQAYQDFTKRDDILWDFTEHMPSDERRHRENIALSEKHFKDNQEFQLKIAEWNMIFNTIMKDKETNARIQLDKGITAINEAKKIVFPDKKLTTKIQVLEKAGVFTPGKFAVLPNTDNEKQQSSIQIIPVKATNESK